MLLLIKHCTYICHYRKHKRESQSRVPKIATVRAKNPTCYPKLLELTAPRCIMFLVVAPHHNTAGQAAHEHELICYVCANDKSAGAKRQLNGGAAKVIG
jgi:hypothetical protein